MYTSRLCRAGLGVAILALVACSPRGADHEAIERAAEAHGGQVTVAGCLQQAEGTGRVLLANALLANERAGFTLREGVPPPEMMVGTTGTTGTVPVRVRGPRYTLDLPEGIGNIQEHIGRQVQVTGTLAGVGGTGEDGAVATSGDGGADTGDGEAEGHIRAEEIRLITAACM